MTTAKHIRDDLIDALRLDLVGPRPGYAPHAAYAAEVLPIAPSKWYLTGFLVPYEAPVAQRCDDDGDETLDLVEPTAAGDDEAAPEAASARKAFFPSSLGLSVLVAPDTTQLRVPISKPAGTMARSSRVARRVDVREGKHLPNRRVSRAPRTAEAHGGLGSGGTGEDARVCGDP